LPVTDPSSEPTALQELLVKSVREAGQLALAKLGAPLQTWHKANASPVSNADIAVDRLLHARLTAATPGYGWLSEESVDEMTRLAVRRVWIVDPIDGTRAYIAGRPDWSIAAALIEDARPILAVIYAPVEEGLFVAAAGRGATLNDARIWTTTGRTLEQARVAGPRRQLEQLCALVPGVRPVPKIHSLALRLARVAQGALDAAFASRSGQDWDLAAADLLVHEAGGALTTLGGERLVYNQEQPVHGALIAAGRERHARLLEVVNERRREFA
jgi:myo-inositol-1(or 4)-monophosphatase